MPQNNSNLNLTAADVQCRLSTEVTFPGGFDVADFADGDAISVTNIQAADMVRGVDGATGYWYIPSTVELTLNLLPGCNASKNLLTLASSIEAQQAPELATITVAIPSMGIVVTFEEGVMTGYPPIPGVKTRLDNMAFTFKFKRPRVATLL